MPFHFAGFWGIKDLQANPSEGNEDSAQNSKTQPIIFQLILATGYLMLCFLVCIALIAATSGVREEQKE